MPLDAVTARQAEGWRDLVPALHVCDGALWRTEQPLSLAGETTSALAERLVREGYFQTGPIAWDLPVRSMASAIATLRAAGIPLAFAFVYDEFWLMVRRLRPLVGAILGPDYRMLPNCMGWHVDPAEGESGWAPHRDRGRVSLHTDGTPKVLTLWLPLTDATPLNGCIYAVPADRDPTYNTEREGSLEFQLSDIRALPAAAGSVLGWTQSLIHWGGRTADRLCAPRISIGCEFQRADAAPFGAPLMDPARIPSLKARLDAVGQSLLRHGHHAPPDAAVEALAVALLDRRQEAA